jgi:hypothetical protein
MADCLRKLHHLIKRYPDCMTVQRMNYDLPVNICTNGVIFIRGWGFCSVTCNEIFMNISDQQLKYYFGRFISQSSLLTSHDK